MIQKTITITVDVPEGYAVKFNKNNNQIEFIDSKPKTWEEYCEQVENTKCYTSAYGSARVYSRKNCPPLYNEFNTEEEAKAFIALGKLIQLHKSWIGNWKPDWKNNDYKYVIRIHRDIISKGYSFHNHELLAFPIIELRDEFLDTFKDLLEEAKPFL